MRHRVLVLCSISLSAVWPIGAQCIVNNPGGSKVSPNRPADSDTAVAAFSPLSFVNSALPHWVCFTSGYRIRAEGDGGANFLPGKLEDSLLTRFRFGVYLSPVSWLHIFAETQDADAFFKTAPLAPPYQETWDLRRAYFDVGNLQESRFAVRAGRQDLDFGGGLLIGTSYWRNASRGYDAVEAVTNWTTVNASFFAASPVIIQDNGLSHHQPGNNLYGIDIRWSRPGSDIKIEPFTFWRLTPRLLTENGTPGNLSDVTAGARATGTIRRNWDYEAEGALQFGQLGADRVRASAWMGTAGYTFGARGLRTRLFAAFDYASGDRNPHDSVHGTFDQLYPNIHDHLGLADQFARQNLKAVRSGIRVWLRPPWIVAAAWNDYWLASRTDGYYNSSGAMVARDPTGRSGNHIAEEYDLQTSYRFDRNLEFGLGVGKVLPGEFLLKTKHSASYVYPYLMMSYNLF